MLVGEVNCIMTSKACFVLKIKLHADFRSIVSFEAHAFRIVYGDYC